MVALLRSVEGPLQPDRSEGTVKQVGKIVEKINALRIDSTQRKDYVEQRWLDDLRNYNGRYSDNVEVTLRKLEQSRLFANLTRPKTNAWAARLGDMLFPSSEPNWGISPTPVPTLSKQAKKFEKQAEQTLDAANKAGAAGEANADALMQQAQDHAARAKKVQAEMEAAQERGLAMEKEIADELIECDYDIRNRDAILDGCKLGTGIIKGPLARHRVRRGWSEINEQLADGTSKRSFKLKTMENPRPEMVKVDPWLWYPDMNGVNVADIEFSLELHMPNKREVQRWAQVPGFDKYQLQRVIDNEPREAPPMNLVAMRSLANLNDALAMRGRYMAWEYHGSLTADEAAMLAAWSGDADELGQIERATLLDYPCIIWNINDQIVKWAPHPLDSAESLYSVWNFEKDNGCIFGFGVPYLMRNSQAAVNGAWRLIMNNGGVAAGPQVLVDRSRAEAADGDPSAIYGFKVWWIKPATLPNQGEPIRFVTTEVRQVELANIITMAMKFIDEETQMPLIASGESASHITKTAQGMAMLMNSVNVIFRRSVKNFDDQMTVPSIRRMYDWNMAFNPDDDIKGDMDVQAKGSSVLLVRELEAQNLMTIADKLTQHPVIGPLLKAPPLARRLFRAHMLPVDELVKNDDEIATEAEERKKNPPPDPEMEKLKVQYQMSKERNEAEMTVAQMNRDTKMMELSMTSNISLAEIKANLMDKREEREMKDRHVAVETAMAEKTGEHAGGSI